MGVDLGKASGYFDQPRISRGSEFFEVRTNRRRDILASGGGDIGDRVGDGQRVEIELRQGDGQAPRLMARLSGCGRLRHRGSPSPWWCAWRPGGLPGRTGSEGCSGSQIPETPVSKRPCENLLSRSVALQPLSVQAVGLEALGPPQSPSTSASSCPIERPLR